ncbi:MAG TPA: GNAT family N-acetyltransferase [Streptosporangiaceae bacterium]|nr:GNAT family N-acetyltransferase [Streptosporangiaceae bacterium]
MTSPRAAVSWRPLDQADLPAITELAQACLSADGGQPFAASPAFLSQCYLSGARARAGWVAGQLICVSSLRQPSAATPAAAAVTTGLVHPDWRRQGVGGHAFDWAAGQAGPGGLRAETEALSDGAHALYLSRGLTQVLAEDVMQLAGAAPSPGPAPAGLALSHWGQSDPARFYAVYAAAFRDRPGFPGWPQEKWIEWISDDEDFRPQWSLLATIDGTDAGFIVGDAAGWITQLGVVPAARGAGLGGRMIAEVAGLMRAAGETTITLNVGTDNPHAIALYRRLGFTRTGRRAKYQS